MPKRTRLKQSGSRVRSTRMKVIPLQKYWVSTDPWRGYFEYKNSVAGGSLLAGDKIHNDDEDVRINKVKSLLKENKIPYRFKTARTSNLFSMVYDIVVSPDDVKRAKQLVKKAGLGD